MIESGLPSCNSIYDFIALLYAFINDEIDIHEQSSFISKVDQHWNEFLTYIQRMDIKFETIFLDQTLENLKQELLKPTLQLDGFSENETFIAICYVLIHGICQCFSESNFSELEKSYGPLNTFPEDCRIYFFDESSIPFHAAGGFKGERNSYHQFKHFISNFSFLIRSNKLSGLGIPVIKHVSYTARKGKITSDEGTLSVRFACFPWGKTRHFTFEKLVPGNHFRVNYSTDNNVVNEVSNKIEKFIYKALEEEANFIVFPEYSIPPYGLEIIKKTLESAKSKDSLHLVFAGSTWGPDNDTDPSKEDNVMTIFDNDGTVLGKYYKYCRFSRKSPTNQKWPKMEWVKNLSFPGKEITLIHMDRIGTILPAICRDSFDNDNTTPEILKTFLPSFIVNAAFSPSVNGIMDDLKRYSKDYCSNYVFYNYCSAVKLGKPTRAIGGAGMAEQNLKKSSVVFSLEKHFIRRRTCIINCNHHPCFFITDFRWSEKERKIDVKKMYCNL